MRCGADRWFRCLAFAAGLIAAPLRAHAPDAALLGQTVHASGAAVVDPATMSAALKQLASMPAYRNVATVSRALGLTKGASLPIEDLALPVSDALQLRALATDEA